MVVLLVVEVADQERSTRNWQRQVDFSLANSAGGGDAFLVLSCLLVGYEGHLFLELSKRV